MVRKIPSLPFILLFSCLTSTSSSIVDQVYAPPDWFGSIPTFFIIAFILIGSFIAGIFIYAVVKATQQKTALLSAPWKEIEGTAKTITVTTQSATQYTYYSVINFRIEQTDPTGNITAITPVEIRGITIHGNVAEGDKIRVAGRLKDGILRAKEAYNLSTNSKIQTE